MLAPHPTAAPVFNVASTRGLFCRDHLREAAGIPKAGLVRWVWRVGRAAVGAPWVLSTRAPQASLPMPKPGDRSRPKRCPAGHQKERFARCRSLRESLITQLKGKKQREYPRDNNKELTFPRADKFPIQLVLMNLLLTGY